MEIRQRSRDIDWNQWNTLTLRCLENRVSILFIEFDNRWFSCFWFQSDLVWAFFQTIPRDEQVDEVKENPVEGEIGPSFPAYSIECFIFRWIEQWKSIDYSNSTEIWRWKIIRHGSSCKKSGKIEILRKLRFILKRFDFSRWLTTTNQNLTVNVIYFPMKRKRWNKKEKSPIQEIPFSMTWWFFFLLITKKCWNIFFSFEVYLWNEFSRYSRVSFSSTVRSIRTVKSPEETRSQWSSSIDELLPSGLFELKWIFFSFSTKFFELIRQFLDIYFVWASGTMFWPLEIMKSLESILSCPKSIGQKKMHAIIQFQNDRNSLWKTSILNSF